MISPVQKQLMAWIGVTLLSIQSTETVIQLCIACVLPTSPNYTWEMLVTRQQQLRTKTLGHLLYEMRRRLKIIPHFEDILAKYLEMRNTFVHNVDEVPGWSLNTDEGIAAAHSFLTDLLRLNETVQAVFLGLLSAWQDENSMHIEVPGMPEHGKRYFEHINATYKPLVDEIFFEKEDDNQTTKH
jgi:hypothetical protein